MRRAITIGAVVGVAVLLSGCAPDPPSAVVGIVVDACDPGEEVGSGAVVAPGLVLTSAHVVAGATDIQVRRNGGTVAATIVGFDPEMDLAYLSFDDRLRTTLDVSSDGVEDGDVGVAWVVRDGEPLPLPVTIRRRVRINTEDIYIQGETVRPGFELEADIQSGDSGGAVLVDGKVVGVVWARSRRVEERAYAIDPVRAGDLIDAQLHDGIGDDIDLTRC
ncbi:MAG: trypsin-like peptidase domain-containing protein [Ilumatobacter sp.]|uniref:trypsin-like peptidase domain-containing protein n=1 Tax=Ilumatobacter sp. TaxID=1967498 RepID=UPI00261CDC0D|nr:trypsin-like peptidase domain-containing protein [Ilumatobacter sp.]MDJ0771497.1 trypsin-like peptidase domain-containing protein [Ilumatobacter sp.]